MKKVGRTKESSRRWWRGLTAYQQADYVYQLKLKRRLRADWLCEFERVVRLNNYATSPDDSAMYYYEQIYCRDGRDIESTKRHKKKPAKPERLELGANPRLILTKHNKQILRELKRKE